MRLNDLLNYDRIVIQTHDNPDADAIASGFGIYLYLKEKGKHPTFIYSGANRIRKSNLTRMLTHLHIPIKYVDELPECDLLLTVDGQYGEGNVTHFSAPVIAVIDHHVITGSLPELSEVRSNLGSCATLVWDMLMEAGFDANTNSNLATALYYGLYMDTGAFAELSHPKDRDLRDQAKYDDQKIALLRNSNLSIEELEVAGTALLRTDLMDEYRCAIVKANPCDPNILGIISDLVLEVDVVNVCVVFSVQPGGVKFSVRSCTRQVLAQELAAVLARGIGSGGGHMQKAGGFLNMDLLRPEYLALCEEQGMKPRMELSANGKSEIPTASACKALIEYRITQFFEDTDFIDAKDFRESDYNFRNYCNKDIVFGYVRGVDFFPVESRVKIRSIGEEDLKCTIKEDTVFVIGNHGDVHLDTSENLNELCRKEDWDFELVSADYTPTISLEDSTESVSLLNGARICIPLGKNIVRAVRLDKNVKIYDRRKKDFNRRGERGDYLIMSEKNGAVELFTEKKELFEERFELQQEASKNKIDAVVFDLDGTLLNTLDDLTDAVNYALDLIHEPKKTVEEVCCFVGNGVRMLMARCIRDGENHPLFDHAFEAFKNYYREHSRDKTRPYDGILELIQELHNRNVKMAIVSNKYDAAVKSLCKAFFASNIKIAIGETEKVRKKPAPDTVMLAIKEMGLSADRAIYVGDSDVDIQTAENAKMRCVSVTWGFRDRQFLVEHGATQLIDTPLELLEFF